MDNNNTTPKRVGLVEYLIEAWGLGTFMVSACLFDVVLEYPSSPIHKMLIASAFVRRALMGCIMGITAVLILCSRWGKRSGAHINPAVTLSFYRLGRIHAVDAVFYVFAQSIGSILGVCLSYAIAGSALAHPSTQFVVTIPGEAGVGGAFIAEVIISAIMMTTVLVVSGAKKVAHLTPYVAGVLVMLFITFEAPFSGMSINPARTLGSAVVARTFDAFWIYVLAPIVGMVGSTEIWRHFQGRSLARKFVTIPTPRGTVRQATTLIFTETRRR